MDQKQLNAIKERVLKATTGPWEIDRNSDDDVFVTDIWFDGEDGGHAEIHGDTVESSIYNAEFIANAYEDVPALVAEVERLQKRLVQTEKCYEIMEKATFKATDKMICFKKALEQIMEVEAPNMEGWETSAYKIACQALGGEEK